MANKAIQALVNSGADAMSNMYEVYIKFPGSKDGANEVMTVRADGFKIPDVAVETYPIEYHGQKIDRPKTVVTIDRHFDLTFRLDAAYQIHQAFLEWQSLAGNPVTGGVSNRATDFGEVKVVALKGGYLALEDDIYLSNTGDKGEIKAGASEEAIRPWTFKDVWVSKVTEPEFKTEGGDKITFQVTFNFGECDYPGYN